MDVSPLYPLLFICVVILQYLAFMHSQNWFLCGADTTPTKYVGYGFDRGGFGNQLFHMITGYGIARTLNRTHYVSVQFRFIGNGIKYLRLFKPIFPNLEKTFFIPPYDDANETKVRFGHSCCDYDNPLRLSNYSDKYLSLTMEYGHNPRYFEDYLPEIRQILQFSGKIQQEGEDVLHSMNITDYNLVCVHIRRTNFTGGSILSDMMSAANAAEDIGKEKRASNFVIFGDDKEIKRGMSTLLKGTTSKKNAILVSNNIEAIDLYISSRICSSFLIATVTSTFGWWLAFFAPNQQNVFYLPDKRPLNDKVPSKELFLKTWKEYQG